MATLRLAPLVVYACLMLACRLEQADGARVRVKQLFDSNSSTSGNQDRDSGSVTQATSGSAASEAQGVSSDHVLQHDTAKASVTMASRMEPSSALPFAILCVVLLIVCLVAVILLIVCLLSYPKGAPGAPKEGEAGPAETKGTAEAANGTNAGVGAAGAGATGAGAEEAPKKTSSFLKPTASAGKAAPKEKSLHWAAELALFAFFILTRAIHPTIIAASKVELPSGKMGYEYASGTTVICMCAFVVACGMAMAAAQGEFMMIWDQKALKIFSINGLVYAVGDWLEMMSMGSLSGAAYQVLLQSKFIFTAILFIYVKNEHQTRLQWLLLVSLMLSCSVYMAIASAGKSSNTPFLGMFFALLKVIVSCLGAVISDKYMKDFKKTPIHIQLVQMGIARFFCSFGLSFIGTDIWGQGFFHGWNPIVFGVFISFVVKSVSTLYLVALLDSMLKNIGEALAIIVIYFWDQIAERVLRIRGEVAPYEIPPLLAIVVVILCVASYLDAKDVVKKAKEFDKEKAKKAKTDA